MKKYIINKIIVIFLFSISLFGCSTQVTEEEIKNVDRIFFHETGKYTVLIKNDNTLTPVILKIRNNVVFKEDIPNEELMHINIVVIKKPLDEYNDSAVFHIRSKDDIDGGSWNHGKFGSGQTNVVE